MGIDFTKYHGLGNDFILIDNRADPQTLVTSEQAVRLCDRHFGVGADGVIFALPGQDGTDYTMRIFNADGSEPEMCGNGIRALAKFLTDLEGEAAKAQYRIHTLGGVMTPKLNRDGSVTVDMGEPQLRAAQIPTTLGSADQKVVDTPLKLQGRCGMLLVSVWGILTALPLFRIPP